jgi:DNA-binding response OmpR family regulator
MATKIAIIEDDNAIAQMYRYKLEADGNEVAIAVNGRKGYELLETFQPNLVLLDIRMPEMNGDEMLQLVREQEWGADMRVIVLTNISRAEAPSVFRFLGVDRYIVKAHYTPTQVLEVVREVLHVK